MQLENWKQIIESMAIPLWLGWLGWVAMMANAMRKGKRFKWYTMLFNIFLAAWIGWVFSTMIPENMGDIKYSLISISWFLSYPILDIMEEKGLDLFINKYLWKK